MWTAADFNVDSGCKCASIHITIGGLKMRWLPDDSQKSSFVCCVWLNNKKNLQKENGVWIGPRMLNTVHTYSTQNKHPVCFSSACAVAALVCVQSTQSQTLAGHGHPHRGPSQTYADEKNHVKWTTRIWQP